MTTSEDGRPLGFRRPRSVAARIVLSYAVVLVVFSAASFWSVWTFRSAALEASLLRQGYLPLALSVRDLVSNQDTWNTQLNHITTAGNPADKRVWFETALSIGRPKKLAEVQAAIDRAFPADEPLTAITRMELEAELARARGLMAPDPTLVNQLFSALSRGERAEAQRLRDRLVRRGLRVQRSLSSIERRLSLQIDALLEAARQREQTALLLLVLAGAFAILVGALMAVYARRVVAPLSIVTARAQAVARGQLSAERPLETNDEIGELSRTFEGMVQAIAEARERLLATERLAAIGKMAAHVTHEVRNPLSSMALNLDLLEEELSADEHEARALVQAIGQEVARLSALSNQYLSMARRNAPELEQCDVGPIVAASAQFMRRDIERKRIDLAVALEPDLPWAEVDQGQIRQAIYNLLRNAGEAMPDGGHIWLAARAEHGEVVIEVADDGPGIPESEVDRLFDPFFTTKNHGTGLGLAVTRQIVAAHGGTLRYETRDTGGARFVIRLPAAEDRSEREKPSEEDVAV